MVFPSKMTVSYHRPKKASAKQIMARQQVELIGDYHDQAKKSLENDGRKPIACRIYQTAVDMAWNELDENYKAYYESEALRARNKPEDIEDKEGYVI